ncbi:MAG: acetyl-CoA carboxylase biotin carboxyl carrier protein subunit [Candidatus Baltobacteraceae bacterium]
MSTASGNLVARVRRLVEVFNQTGLVRLRISDDEDNSIELRRAARPAAGQTDHVSVNGTSSGETVPVRALEMIKADLVGIAYLSKPAAIEGGLLDGDRELAYVEALGIRNPVRSRGAGRVVAVLITEGQPVEYGQPLFEIERV